MRRLTALAVVLLGCSDERTLVLERLPLVGCAESLLPQVTQVLIGAEGDFPEQVLSQPPDQPFSAAAFPQSSRVLTVTGIVAGQPTLVGRTGELDLVHEPATLPVAYGPAGGTCATTPMHHARSHAAAVRMQDGRVLVAGGGDPSIEIYDPRAATWTLENGLYDPLPTSAAALLHDGRVLIVGAAGAQLVDTGGHLVRPPLLLRGGARAQPIAVTLADGRVLVAGSQASSVIYDPSIGDFVDGPGLLARSGGQAFVLPDDRVLLVGGGANAEIVPADANGPGISFAASAVAWAPLPTGAVVGFGPTDELVHDDTTDSLAGVASGASADAVATPLADDLLLLVDGGMARLFVPASSSFPSATPAGAPGATATLLDDGTVLIAGGGTTAAALYFHSTGSAWSTPKVMTFDDDEPALIPHLPARAHRANGSYVIDGTFALVGGARFADVTVRLSFAHMGGDPEILVGWTAPTSQIGVRFRQGGPVEIRDPAGPRCSGGAAPDGGFVEIAARGGHVSVRLPDGTEVLGCDVDQPRGAVGVAALDGAVSIDNLELVR